MVSFLDLRDAKPELWKVAADDWVNLAQQAEQSADDIYDRGTAALNEHWTDAVGERAAARMKNLANSYQVAAATIRGVVATLDGIGESIAALQNSLHAAMDYAKRYGLVVNESGQVSQQPGVHCEDDEAKISQANRLIKEAVDSATKVDDEANSELKKLATAVDNSDLDKSLNELQQSASENQLDMLRNSLPIGADAVTVAAWWRSLTPHQQAEYERALPVELHDLDGIPEEVKERLRGADGYNRVEMVRWAQQNVNNNDIDIFDNNCANFVSHAMEHGGLEQKVDFWWGTLSDDSWAYGLQTGWDVLDAHDFSHSASWAQSDAQRDFFLKHGGVEVPLAQAQPGDIIYWEQAGQGGPAQPGNVHHAAAVTSVTPDGNVHYTQHTSSRLDAGLDGRLPANEIEEGDQRVVIVRPKQTW